MSDLANRPPLGQKTGNPVNGTAAGLAHMARVKALPCCVCLRPGPSSAHHVICDRYGQRKASDFETIPLCWDCHQGPHSIHADKGGWVELHGEDWKYIKETMRLINPGS